MVKPIGVVAMLILLASGPALAGEKLFTKNIQFWGVTNTGNIYLETKRGEQYIASIKHCPINTLKNTHHSPAVAIENMRNPRAWFDNDHWFDDTGTALRRFVISDGLKGRLECVTDKVAQI